VIGDFTTDRMLYHGFVKCSAHLANCPDFPIAPVSLFVDVDKESSHVRLFLNEIIP
jgi:hypothetical protein